MPKIVTMLRDY